MNQRRNNWKLEIRSRSEEEEKKEKEKGRRNKRQTNGTVRNQVSKRESVLPEEFKEGNVDATRRDAAYSTIVKKRESRLPASHRRTRIGKELYRGETLFLYTLDEKVPLRDVASIFSITRLAVLPVSCNPYRNRQKYSYFNHEKSSTL